MVKTFGALGVPEDLIAALVKQGIAEPTPIQEAVIPDLLAGRHVLGQAPTGSGKTLGYGLPLMVRVPHADPQRPRALVLTPTRELAHQVTQVLTPLGNTRGVRVLGVYGGASADRQIQTLIAGAEVIVATPGRLIDLVRRNAMTLGEVDFVVVDEADRMAAMGFLDSVKEVLAQTSPTAQMVFFSATIDTAVLSLTEHIDDDPVEHRLLTAAPDLASASHHFMVIRPEEKVGVAADLVQTHGSTMIFCSTKKGVNTLSKQLRERGVRTGWIHGGRNHFQRRTAMLAFTDARVDVLVATDLAARGLHVDDVRCVVHFDPPADASVYVHRSGRTARAGASGVVVSLVTEGQRPHLRRVYQELGLEASEDTDPT